MATPVSFAIPAASLDEATAAAVRAQDFGRRSGSIPLEPPSHTGEAWVDGGWVFLFEWSTYKAEAPDAG